MILFNKLINKFKGEFASNALFSFTLKISGLALSYLFTLIVSRVYGAEVVGRFSLAFTVLNIFAIVFALGVPDAMVKVISDKNYKEKFNLKKTSLTTVAVSSIIGALVLFFAANSLAEFYKDSNLNTYFLTAAYTMIPLIILRYNFELLRGENKIIKFGILSHVLPYLIAVLVLVGFYFINSKSGGSQTMTAYFIGVTIAFVISIIFTKTNTHREKVAFPFKKMMSYSLPMLTTSSFIFLMSWTDTLMLGYYNSKADVGVYNVVVKIARIAIVVLTSVNLVLAPKISELYSKSKTGEMKMLIKKATNTIFYITTPIVLLIIIANTYILSFFGDEFIAGSTALVIIMVSQLFNALTGSVGQIMNMTGHHVKLRNYTIICVIINIALNALLIPLYGIIGSAIATAFSSIIINLFCVIFVKQKMKITTYFSPFK